MTEPVELYDDLCEEIQTVLVGNEDAVEILTIALLTRGHVLVEGVPGVAKTTIARLFAEATGLDATRIQMTPDILPADITGTRVYREPTGEFELRRGPVFANLVIADEINRATPKTQSALLEAMQENTVTIDGETLSLPKPFFVVATQNPIEMEGTYELPIAQRDRFQLKLTVGTPERDEELTLIERFDDHPTLSSEHISQVVTIEEIFAARRVVEDVHVDQEVKRYLREIVNATRESSDLEYGGSPRATLSFLQGAKARAAIRGREYVIPDDVKELAQPILTHRLVTSTEAGLNDVTASNVVDGILDAVEPPDGADTVAQEGGDETIVEDVQR